MLALSTFENTFLILSMLPYLIYKMGIILREDKCMFVRYSSTTVVVP